MSSPHHRRFYIFSLANWAVAIASWMVSAYLGVTSPTSMIVYTLLFVIGLIAVIVGVLAWLVARFGLTDEDLRAARAEAARADATGSAQPVAISGDDPATASR